VCVTNCEVSAVPDNVTSRNSFGANYLIKGADAKLVQQWQDVAAELPIEIAACLLPPDRRRRKGQALRRSNRTRFRQRRLIR